MFSGWVEGLGLRVQEFGVKDFGLQVLRTCGCRSIRTGGCRVLGFWDLNPKP